MSLYQCIKVFHFTIHPYRIYLPNVLNIKLREFVSRARKILIALESPLDLGSTEGPLGSITCVMIVYFLKRGD